MSCPKGETEKMVYKSDSDEEVLTVEKKVFDLTETGASIFYESENRQWVCALLVRKKYLPANKAKELFRTRSS